MNQTDLTPEFILSEVKKLQYLYGLKHEIRYGQKRPENDVTESVAEHIYGMHLCAQYFLPLEDPTRQWDRVRIYEMITIHDLDEIETGDTISYLKTDADYAAEKEARATVLEQAPEHYRTHLQSLSNEYEARVTPEAKFVKAIDAFEPLIQVYSDFGRFVCSVNKTTRVDSAKSKDIPIALFPIMNQFYQTIHEAMADEGIYYRQSNF